MKWYWRIYKINGSFKTAADIIGVGYASLDINHANNSSVFVGFDGTRHGAWSSSTSDYCYRPEYEFKGNVGLKETRKQKFEKLKKDGKIL